MAKSKMNQLLELQCEVAAEQSSFNLRSPESRLSYLAAGLWIAVKGTKMEIDARMLIEQIYPEFFNDSDNTGE